MSSHSGGRTGRTGEIPKASDAFFIWRWFAREIDADLLRFYQIDIRDWFTGVLDSRRLLNLLEALPNESMFKKWAVRGGDWSEDQYVQARLVNETALARADGKGYVPNLLKSPFELADDEAADTYRRNRHDETLKMLRGEVTDGDHS